VTKRTLGVDITVPLWYGKSVPLLGYTGPLPRSRLRHLTVCVTFLVSAD